MTDIARIANLRARHERMALRAVEFGEVIEPWANAVEAPADDKAFALIWAAYRVLQRGYGDREGNKRFREIINAEPPR